MRMRRVRLSVSALMVRQCRVQPRMVRVSHGWVRIEVMGVVSVVRVRSLSGSQLG